MMRPISLALAAALTLCGLTACTSTGSDSSSGGGGLSQSFEMSNYRRADNTNGTQTRPDVNRVYTQPSLPMIINRGN